ncbi:MAG: NYN domain-containing protein, partial [Dehalococcoidia bacterium]|nr:NYN domain-containing protein [Dehalococcoidia bacterium]
VVVLVDYDNFEICIRRDLAMPADLTPVVRFCQTLGTVVAARAYGSWDDAQLRMLVYRSGVEPAFAPVFPTSGMQQGEGKSVADTALVADGIDLLHLLRPDVMVVVSSDKDLMPLVRMARLRGAHVVVVGSDYTAAQLSAAADRVVTYRELVGGPRQRGAPMPPGAYQPSGPVLGASVAPGLSPGLASPVASAPIAAAPMRPPTTTAAPPQRPPDQASESPSGGRRRRRRRRRSSDQPDAVGVDVVDGAETAASVADDVFEDEPPAESAPVAQPPTPAIETTPRLPFRRPDYVPPRAPEAAVQPRSQIEWHPRAAPPAPTVAAPTPTEATATPIAESPAAAVPTADDEVRRPESAIGPIRIAALPARATAPEEPQPTPAIDEWDVPVVRPPLEQIIGRVVSRAGSAPDAPPTWDAPRAEPTLATVVDAPTTAEPAAAPTEPIAPTGAPEGRRRRRRRRGGRSQTVDVDVMNELEANASSEDEEPEPPAEPYDSLAVSPELVVAAPVETADSAAPDDTTSVSPEATASVTSGNETSTPLVEQSVASPETPTAAPRRRRQRPKAAADDTGAAEADAPTTEAIQKPAVVGDQRDTRRRRARKAPEASTAASD